MRAVAVPLAGLAVLLAGCRQEVEIRGTVEQVGKGVPGARVSMECPDGSKYVTTTSAVGEFRFEDLGAGVDDACELQLHLPGGWVPTQSVASQCRQHDAKAGLCTVARFVFRVP
jgi:hypothetical protein